MTAMSREVYEERHAHEVQLLSPAQREIYEASLAAGSDPSFALMCACRQPPGTRNTDRAFCEGARRQMESMRPGERAAIIAEAKRAGIQTDGKFYKGGLGGYTDPAAWVSCAEDVVTAAKLKNLSVEGVINVKGTKIERPPPDVKLAPDLVNTIASDYMAKDPALREKCRKSRKALGELKEMVVDRHGKKKPPPAKRRIRKLARS